MWVLAQWIGLQSFIWERYGSKNAGYDMMHADPAVVTTKVQARALGSGHNVVYRCVSDSLPRVSLPNIYLIVGPLAVSRSGIGYRLDPNLHTLPLRGLVSARQATV